MISPAVNAQARRLDATLLAIADPTRRAILERLHAGEARVTDVAEPFHMSLNAVSKHIRVLEGAGLVARRKAGREHFISANLAPLAFAAAWIERQRAFWTARLDALDELLRTEDAARARRKPKKGAIQ
jgi:DNA-binding transcriptional ArsR family regulator